MPNRLPHSYEQHITIELELKRVEAELAALLDEFSQCRDLRKLKRIHLAMSSLKEAIELYKMFLLKRKQHDSSRY